ncbi:MAG: chromate efflux transporter [Salinarimonas sp.]|nr:chromate efflux transporter [Salinarimonas sp.]
MRDDFAAQDPGATEVRPGSVGEVFAAFGKLGVTAFGGPIAHLGYFREEFVMRRKWLDEKGYADLVALSQFLPGPASSQVGFALGLMRAGPAGAAAAFLAFTLPSALIMIAFAYGAHTFAGPIGSGIIDGLKIVAVAIIAHAVWGMARQLCPDRIRASIALGAVLIALIPAGAYMQVLAIAIGAVFGLALCRDASRESASALPFAVSRATGFICLAAFAVLLIGLPLATAAGAPQGIALFDAFYRAGALVFGGGHVVLPLLEAETVRSGWTDADTFLAGYGAAQALPGPLFTFAAYLGAAMEPWPNGILGAMIALVAVFMPGFLLLVGVIPFWNAFRERPAAQALMRGANAAVVGILGAALYTPVFTSAVVGPGSFALALTCFLLLLVWKVPPWAVVIVAALGGGVMGAM